MEETAVDQSSATSTVTTGTATAPKSKLRYPLRSAAKKPDQSSPAQLSSTTRRGRQAGAVSQSVGVLDLSGKERSAKPPRRMSIPSKSVAASPSTAVPGGSITPIPESRSSSSATNGIKAKTLAPVSDGSRSVGRFRAFDLASSSYWLSQIKLSESASKHSVSIGFFKLALEAGCQPVTKMKDELKAYTRRHKLEDEHGDAVNELLEAYNTPNVPDQIQVSVRCSGVPQEGTRSSDDEIHSVASAAGTRKLKPKSLNADAVKSTSPKGTTTTAARSAKGSLSKGSVNSRPGGHNKAQKRIQKMTKQEAKRGSDKAKIVKNPAKESATEGQVTHATSTDSVQENKENMDGGVADEISVGGAM